MVGGIGWALWAVAATSTVAPTLSGDDTRAILQSALSGDRGPLLNTTVGGLAQPTQKLIFRLALGPEWDTNAPRAVDFGTQAQDTEPREDALVRMVLATQAALKPAPGHDVSVVYVLGAKRFFELQAEDQLTHRLNISSTHDLGRASVSAFGVYRGSRIRDGDRDYDIGLLGTLWRLPVANRWQVNATAVGLGYRFPSNSQFDYVGSQLGTGLSFFPATRWSVSGRFDYLFRHYLNTDPEVWFTDQRQDHVLQGQIRMAYQGPFVIRGFYLVGAQQSTSQFENITRHRLSASATFRLPWSVIVNLLAALQINDGRSITDVANLADDENRSVLQVQLQRPLWGRMSFEVRWSLYANQFGSSSASFFRQTVYGGLSYRTTVLGD